MNKITKTLIISSITNIILSLFKVIFGFFGKCNSLIADGVHSLSDLLTDFIAIVGNKMSMKPADDKHPFGHGKIEYLTSLIIGIIIIILGFSLIYNAFNKEIVIPNLTILIVSVVTIISKYIVSNYIYRKGKKYNNAILLASSKESKMDVLTSIFVLISIILMQFSKTLEMIKYTDIITTIIIAIFIIRTGYLVIKENISTILDEQVQDENYLNSINNLILQLKEIDKIESLYVLKYGHYYKLIGNIIMEEGITLNKAHEVIDDLEIKLKEFDDKIKYVFIHMEPKEKDLK